MLEKSPVYALFRIFIKVPYIMRTRKKIELPVIYDKVCLQYTEERQIQYGIRDYLVNSLIQNIDIHRQREYKKFLNKKILSLIKKKQITWTKLSI